MANAENLTPFTSDQSREEAAKNGAKGGKASGEARRRKRNMRETLAVLMETPAPPSVKAKLAAAGIDVADADYQVAVLAAQLLQAVKGNTRAAILLSEIMGERVQNVTIDQKIDDSRKELEAYFGEKEATDT